VVAERNITMGHRLQHQKTVVLAKKSIQTELHPDNTDRESGFFLEASHL
jgi:hypothetical protein